MLAFGLIGWLFEANGIPVAAATLGIVLGGMLASSFVTSMLKSQDGPLVLVGRPMAAVLALLVLWVTPTIAWWRNRNRTTA